MNNETVRSFTVKKRGDRVYDIYTDGQWVASRGATDNVLDVLRTLMEEEEK
jgi:hypothetical protein